MKRVHAAVSSPSVTVCSVHINPKVQEKLYDVVVAGTHCVMEGRDALVIRGAGIVNLHNEIKQK